MAGINQRKGERDKVELRMLEWLFPKQFLEFLVLDFIDSVRFELLGKAKWRGWGLGDGSGEGGLGKSIIESGMMSSSFRMIIEH